MLLVPFIEHYRPILKGWLQARDLNASAVDSVPLIGYIVFSDEGKALAAGFLRTCEGQLGMIEGLIADPTQDYDTRDQAIDVIVTSLICKAKDININKILSYSVNKNTLLRSKRFGFEVIPQTLIGLSLS